MDKFLKSGQFSSGCSEESTFLCFSVIHLGGLVFNELIVIGSFDFLLFQCELLNFSHINNDVYLASSSESGIPLSIFAMLFSWA